MKTVCEIIEEYLKEEGFDGLYSDQECACETRDLVPCGEDFSDCRPGHRIKCDCGDHNWHMSAEKEE